MRITDFIEQQNRLLDESSRRIRNFRIFDFNYIPEQPLTTAIPPRPSNRRMV